MGKVDQGYLPLIGPEMCYTEKATEARHRLERQYTACANRKKQCRPNETQPYSNATHPEMCHAESLQETICSHVKLQYD